MQLKNNFMWWRFSCDEGNYYWDFALKKTNNDWVLNNCCHQHFDTKLHEKYEDRFQEFSQKTRDLYSTFFFHEIITSIQIQNCLIFLFYFMLMSLTGEGKLSQWDVAVQTVIDQTDANALSLHLHTGQRGRVAAGAGVGSGSGVARYVLSVLKQPHGSLVQLTWGTKRSVHMQGFIKLFKTRSVLLTFTIHQCFSAVIFPEAKIL